MDFKLAVILVILAIGSLHAAESYDKKSLEDTTKGNATDIYYKGLKVEEPSGLCKENLCVKKCCPFGAEYNVTRKICVNTTEIFNPLIYDKYLRPQNANATALFYFKIGITRCKPLPRFLMSVFASQRRTEFYFRTDGKIYIPYRPANPPWFLVSPENYCIDNFVDDTGSRKVDALVCFVEDEEEPHNYVLTATCMLVSCAFILLTVGVYIWLPKLHNVHGRVLIAYLSCLFVGFLLMATMQLLLYYGNTTNETCKTLKREIRIS